MALEANVFGLDAGGKVIWRFLARLWDGHDLLRLLRDRLESAEPSPSWECHLTPDEVQDFSARFDGPDYQSRFPKDPNLGELLTRPDTVRILLRIEEWGYG